MEGRALQDRLCAVIHPILSLVQRRDCTRTHNTAWQCLDMCFNVVKKQPPDRLHGYWTVNHEATVWCAPMPGVASFPVALLLRWQRDAVKQIVTMETLCNLISRRLRVLGGGETVDNHRWTYRKDWFTQSVQSCFCTSPPEAWLQVDYIFFI